MTLFLELNADTEIPEFLSNPRGHGPDIPFMFKECRGTRPLLRGAANVKLASTFKRDNIQNRSLQIHLSTSGINVMHSLQSILLLS